MEISAIGKHFSISPVSGRLILIFFVFLVWSITGCPSLDKVRTKMPRLFTTSFTMQTGAEPSFMIAEDFNRDGEKDLVVTNSGDNTLSYFKGKGDGTFKDQIIIRTGEDPICVVTSDFNNNGYLDLAVLNYRDQTINIYFNSRFGNFKKTRITLRPGKIPINMNKIESITSYEGFILTIIFYIVMFFYIIFCFDGIGIYIRKLNRRRHLFSRILFSVLSIIGPRSACRFSVRFHEDV